MLTLVALVVCQVKVVDWPGSRVFGFADSEAVGAVSEGGGGGGGGAAFLAHAPRNRIAPRANISVLHLAIVGVFTLIACFTDSSFLCARVVACNLQLHGRAHPGPAVKTVLLLTKPSASKSLPRGAQGSSGSYIYTRRPSVRPVVKILTLETKLLPTPVGLRVRTGK